MSALLLAVVLPVSAFGQTAAAPDGVVRSWAGAFAGAQILGSLGKVGTSESTAATGALFHHFDSFAAGAGGGFDFGYNWLLAGGRWLVGAVAAIDFLDDSAGHVFATTDRVTASGQVRLGFLATPGLLWYGETGIGLARESLKVEFGGPSTEQNRVAPGYAIGAGAEWALPLMAPRPFAKAPSLFVDYQHIWWESETLEVPAAAPSLNFHWQRQSNIVKAGLRVHF